MLQAFSITLAMLILILIAAEVFTNALEHFGEKIGISEGITGSLLAAVGTALPEASIPLLAIFSGTKDTQVNHEIGIGAILGAPVMLSTLTLGLMAFSVLKKRGQGGFLKPEKTGLNRDLNFFLIAFGTAILAMFIPAQLLYLRIVVSVLLVCVYFLYIFMTIRSSAKLVEQGHGTQAGNALFLTKIKLPTNTFTICFQLLLGLALLVAGAKGFISEVGTISHFFGISALLLSLLIIPVATELPEKINSILWLRKNKDTLAFGNITGALVFQGSLLPAVGIALTPWQPSTEVITGAVVTLIAAIWLKCRVQEKGIKVRDLLLNGLLYVSYLVMAFHFS